jgi:phenylpropionate dioxygenase-like ring-hydroxylating dioxygenase large terminal subunit
MTTNNPFLNTAYNGYLHNRVPPEDNEITHVGPGTPGGEWFRRFWIPVFAMADLGDLPTAIRILGEDLVVFKDRSGQIGLLELHCSHRGTSLEFAQIQERGIRCCYHAWCYDVDGKILDTPGEPVESTLKERLYHGAYPTLECNGLVFTYMGPPDKRPVFPFLDTYNMPGYQTRARVHDPWPCNWLQFSENVHDPAHLLFLHMIEGNTGFTGDLAEQSEIDFMETSLGMVKIDARRVGDRIWVRIGDFIPPMYHQGCGIHEDISDKELDVPGLPNLGQFNVPVDDTHTRRIDFWFGPEGQDVYTGEETYGQQAGPYEERQRTPGDYDALTSQRPIAVHDMEHLASTDRGVIMGRNIIRRGIRAVQNGETPIGSEGRVGESVRTFAHERVLLVPPAANWEADRKLIRETGREIVRRRAEEISSTLVMSEVG